MAWAARYGHLAINDDGVANMGKIACAAGKLPKDASFSMATHVDGAMRAARNHRRSAAEVCYATTALASSTGSLLLDGLGSGSDEQMRAEVGEMLDALVLLLQSAATQYGVRAEVDAYVLPLVTLVQQAVLGPAGRRQRGGGAARSRCSPPDRTTTRRPTATATATATASPTSRRRSPPARGPGRSNLRWRPSTSSRRS